MPFFQGCASSNCQADMLKRINAKGLSFSNETGCCGESIVIKGGINYLIWFGKINKIKTIHVCFRQVGNVLQSSGKTIDSILTFHSASTVKLFPGTRFSQYELMAQLH